MNAPDEDIEPRARRVDHVKCAKCKGPITWDGSEALWCDGNKECTEHHRVFWNADLRELLSLS